MQLLLDLSSPKIKILKWIDGCIPVKVKYPKCRNQQEIERNVLIAIVQLFLDLWNHKIKILKWTNQ